MSTSIPIAQQAGLPRTWKVGPEEFTVSGITYHQMATLSAHLREAIPHPVDEAKALLDRLGDLADAEYRRALVVRATRAIEDGLWPPTFESAEGNRYYFTTPLGIAFYLHTILCKHHRDLTLDEVARRIAPHVTIADMDRLSVAIELIDEATLAGRKAREAGLDVEAPPAEAIGGIVHTESQAPKASSSPSVA